VADLGAPGFDLASLRATFEASNGEGLDSGLPDPFRFLSGVVKGLLARRHIDSTGADSTEPAIFFMGTMPESLGPRPAPTSTFTQGLTELNGKIWCVNVEARYGHGLPHTSTADELLELARSDSFLRQLPTLLYMPAADSNPVMFFENGVAEESTRRVDYELVEPGAITANECIAAIERLHAQSLITPGSVNLWADAAAYKPVPRTERVMQGLVRAALIGAFPWLHATEEHATSSGRYDIGLVSIAGAVQIFRGLIELKVLRKTENPGVAIKKGIKQASSYAARTGSPWADLFTFNMRPCDPSTNVFADHLAHAARRNVGLMNWNLFPDADRLRDYEDLVAAS
jgi:hypothetical protein